MRQIDACDSVSHFYLWKIVCDHVLLPFVHLHDFLLGNLLPLVQQTTCITLQGAQRTEVETAAGSKANKRAFLHFKGMVS